MADDRRVAAALLERHGQTFADEAGISVSGGSPKALSQLLELTILLSARVQHGIAVSGAQALFAAGLGTPQQVLDAPDERIAAILDKGDYVRYDNSKRDAIRDSAQLAVDRYDGDLRQLRQKAEGDIDRMRGVLTDFKGIGEVGAEIFLREVQQVWEEVRPFAGRAAVAGAKALGIPANPADLASLVAEGDVTRLMAALVRVDLAGDADEVRAAAG